MFTHGYFAPERREKRRAERARVQEEREYDERTTEENRRRRFQILAAERAQRKHGLSQIYWNDVYASREDPCIASEGSSRQNPEATRDVSQDRNEGHSYSGSDQQATDDTFDDEVSGVNRILAFRCDFETKINILICIQEPPPYRSTDSLLPRDNNKGTTKETGNKYGSNRNCYK